MDTGTDRNGAGVSTSTDREKQPGGDAMDVKTVDSNNSQAAVKVIPAEPEPAAERDNKRG